MEIFLRSRGLYRISMATEVEPTTTIENSKYLNRMDEAYESLCMNISLELLFHISSCKTPNEVWTTMKGLFGKQDEMKGHMLEVEQLSLDPRSFDNIQDFFTRYKDLLLPSMVAGLINLRRKNGWFYPSSSSLDQNTLYLSPRFI